MWSPESLEEHENKDRKTLEYLRSLDAGKGEQIPTLREVCDTVAGRAVINIELKGRGTARPTAALLAELVKEKGWSSQKFLVSSFLRRELRAFKVADGGRTPLGLLLARPTRLSAGAAVRLGAVSINPPLKHTTARLVEQAHARGLRVYVYTVNEPADFQRMRDHRSLLG